MERLQQQQCLGVRRLCIAQYWPWTRHRQSRHLDAVIEACLRAVVGGVAQRQLLPRALHQHEHAISATRLIEHCRRTSRGTRHLHLAIAVGAGAGELATADRVMAEAATELGIKVARFD